MVKYMAPKQPMTAEGTYCLLGLDTLTRVSLGKLSLVSAQAHCHSCQSRHTLTRATLGTFSLVSA